MGKKLTNRELDAIQDVILKKWTAKNAKLKTINDIEDENLRAMVADDVKECIELISTYKEYYKKINEFEVKVREKYGNFYSHIHNSMRIECIEDTIVRNAIKAPSLNISDIRNTLILRGINGEFDIDKVIAEFV